MPDINKAYSWAIQCCNAPNVGYSQSYRNGRTVDGITYFDCSSFINYALLAGGWETPNYAPSHNAFTTASEVTVLKGLGFREVSPTGVYMAGDIGWKTGHTEMCYKGGNGKGIFMGAHTSNAILANQVSIGSSKGDPNYQRSFTKILRFGDSPAEDVTPTIEVISAIDGNLWYMNGINPAIWYGNDPPSNYWDMHTLNKGFGIGDWSNGDDPNGRLYKMAEWVLARSPYLVTDGTNQTLYILEEKYWTPNPNFPEFPDFDSFIQSKSTDIERLTHAFHTCWCDFKDASLSWDLRVEAARDCYSYINENLSNPGIFGGMYQGPYYLNTAQRLNNAMWVYLTLTGYISGEDTLPDKKGLKPWEMIRNPYYYMRR